MDTQNILVPSILIVFSLLFSAFFSGSEIAMFSVNRYRLQVSAKRDKSQAAKLALSLLENQENLLGTILICNNVVNVFASIMAGLLANAIYGNIGVAVAGALVTFVMIVVGEIAPKLLASRHSEAYVKACVYPVWFLCFLFAPLVALVTKMAEGLLFLIGLSKVPPKKGADLDELQTVLSRSQSIDEQHKQMLLSTLSLHQKEACDIMTQVSDIQFLDLSKSEEELLKFFKKNRYDILPVSQSSSMEDLIGVFYSGSAVSLLDKKGLSKEKLKEKLTQPLFVPERVTLLSLLTQLIHKKHEVAFVVDAYGNIQGMVTPYDIMGQVTKTFNSNKTNAIGYVEEEGEAILLLGEADVEEINRYFELSLPNVGGVHTLSGLIINELETLPEGAFSIKIDQYLLDVLSLSNHRVKRVRLHLPKKDITNH